MAFIKSIKQNLKKSVDVPLFLTDLELSSGCNKEVPISRIGRDGTIETLNLNVIVPSGVTVGTVFVFDGIGDYLKNGIFQDVNIIVQKEQKGPVEFKFDQSDKESKDNSSNSTDSIASPNQDSVPAFECVKVSKAWDWSINNFENGDVGIQIRCPVCFLASNSVVFKCTLDDGSVVTVKPKDVDAFGVSIYKQGMFSPKENTGLSGNILLLIIADNVNYDQDSTTKKWFGFRCC